MGIESDALSRAALTCEKPFPSPHRLSCSYAMFVGAIFSIAFCKSFNTPDSYSMVVIEPVEPEQKTVTRPFFMPAWLQIEDTWLVMSTKSQNPLVLREIVSENTIQPPDLLIKAVNLLWFLTIIYLIDIIKNSQ
jgi:hypothetical protein